MSLNLSQPNSTKKKKKLEIYAVSMYATKNLLLHFDIVSCVVKSRTDYLTKWTKRLVVRTQNKKTKIG